MPQFKYQKYFNQNDATAYDSLSAPGTIAANSGIYRCETCGDEVAANKNNPLPPQNHHQHKPGLGHIKWRLVAFAQQVK